MSTFLNALKTKSASVQSNLENAKTVNSWTGKESIADQAKAIEGMFRSMDPVVTPEVTPITVKIERVVNRNRLDIYFSDIPSVEIRDSLKNQGFRFDGERKAWYHKDTLLNRLYLHTTFGAPDLLTMETLNFDSNEIKDTDTGDRVGDTSKTPQNPILETEDDSEKVSEEFKRYKMQVNALVEELKLDPADLMIRAIGCLYDSVFRVN